MATNQPTLESPLGSPGLLLTPDVSAGPRWPSLRDPLNTLATTCGLFDSDVKDTPLLLGPGEDGLYVDPILTPTPPKDEPGTAAMDPLDLLDPREVEDLLEEISPSALHLSKTGTGVHEEPQSCLTDPPLTPSLEDLLATVTEPAILSPAEDLLRSLSHDHDYLSPDMKVFAEFFDPARPPPLEEELGVAPSFMDSLLDLRLFLDAPTAPSPAPAPAPAPAHAPAPAPAQLSPSSFEAPASPVEVKAGVGTVRDARYYERRQKNNIASRISRQSRKERRQALLREKEELASRNADLKTEVRNLEELAASWKEKLLRILAE